MRALLWIVAVACFLVYGCAGKDTEAISDKIESLNRQLEAKKKELAAKDQDIAKVQADKTKIEKEFSDLKNVKELATYEFTSKPMVEISVDTMEFVIAIKGQIKNTGPVQMNNVTLKVAFMNEFNSKILDRNFQKDTPVPEMTDLSPYHVYYTDVADTLNPNDTRDFTMKIYFKNFQGSLDQLKPCVDAWNSTGKRVQIGIIWGDYREKE